MKRTKKNHQAAAIAAALKKTSSSDSVVNISLTQLSTIYVLFIIINSAIVYLAHTLFPQSVVLGTHVLSPMIALLQSMLFFTLLVVGSMPVLEILAKTLKYKLSEKSWILIYYAVNVIGLWITARFAELVGMGISSWMVAVILGLVLSLLQSLANKMFKAID
jgi:hypothetical protein